MKIPLTANSFCRLVLSSFSMKDTFSSEQTAIKVYAIISPVMTSTSCIKQLERIILRGDSF